jgi:hypothetical protein
MPPTNKFKFLRLIVAFFYSIAFVACAYFAYVAAYRGNKEALLWIVAAWAFMENCWEQVQKILF